jgi:predicted metal-dependent phosphoesterase TrpH
VTGLYYDFHIHSALSPCADDEMTPNNIVNMSIIKGRTQLPYATITARITLAAIDKGPRECGLVYIPG